MSVPVYINYTNQEKYNRIKNKIQNNLLDAEQVEKYNHTLFIVSSAGLPALNTSSCNIYLGSQIISDIINLNNFKEIIIEEDESTHYLTVYRNGVKDTLICNPNKFYIYCKYDVTTSDSYFNIYFYNENTNVYMPITYSGTHTSSINYVADELDIGNIEVYEPKTIVYYPQT